MEAGSGRGTSWRPGQRGEDRGQSWPGPGHWANLSRVRQRNVLYTCVLVSACCITNYPRIQLVTRTHSGFLTGGSVGPR